MAQISVAFDVECDNCGAMLDASVEQDRHGNVSVKVEPCAKCLSDRYDMGYRDGQADS